MVTLRMQNRGNFWIYIALPVLLENHRTVGLYRFSYFISQYLQYDFFCTIDLWVDGTSHRFILHVECVDLLFKDAVMYFQYHYHRMIRWLVINFVLSTINIFWVTVNFELATVYLLIFFHFTRIHVYQSLVTLKHESVLVRKLLDSCDFYF